VYEKINAYGDGAYAFWALGAFQKVHLYCSSSVIAVKPCWISQSI